MRPSRRVLALTFICLASFAGAQKQWRQRSEDAVAQVLGPHWRRLARDSGFVFSGSVLEIHTPRGGNQDVIPTVSVTLHVDRAIVGVHPGEILTIREWVGAWSQHPLHDGQRVLLLLYPRSRLGLTSPVGGSLGQVALSVRNTVVPPAFVAGIGNGPPLRRHPGHDAGAEITLPQLERAIRSARHDQTAHDIADKE
jgi:hypothetical protein